MYSLSIHSRLEPEVEPILASVIGFLDRNYLYIINTCNMLLNIITIDIKN